LRGHLKDNAMDTSASRCQSEIIAIEANGTS
jgi:hypothetical protein